MSRIWEKYPQFHKLKTGKEKKMICKKPNPQSYPPKPINFCSSIEMVYAQPPLNASSNSDSFQVTENLFLKFIENL